MNRRLTVADRRHCGPRTRHRRRSPRPPAPPQSPRRTRSASSAAPSVTPGKFVKDDQRFKTREHDGQVRRDGHAASTRARGRIRTRSRSSRRSSCRSSSRAALRSSYDGARRDPENPEGDPHHPIVDNGAPLAAGATLAGRHDVQQDGRGRLRVHLPRQQDVQVQGDRGQGLEALLLLRHPPLDAGQDQASSSRDAIGPAIAGPAPLHARAGSDRAAGPRGSARPRPLPTPPSATSGWRRCRRRGTPCPTPATRFTARASTRPRRRSRPSSTGATRAAGASRSGSRTRRAPPPAASTGR